MNYPKELVPGLYWAFDSGVFDNIETFKDELLEYDEENEDLISAWEEPLLDSKEVLVQFINYGAFGSFDDEEEEESEDDDDIVVHIQSNAPLKTGEFLFALNNLVAPHLENSDHYFFESLSLHQDPENPTPPVYYLFLGS